MVALVQSRNGNAGSAVLSFALAYSSNVTAGSFLACTAGAGSTSQTFTVSDNLNGSWTASTFSHNHSAIGIFYLPNALGGATTVTVTNGISTNVILSIAEISGVVSLSPFIDQTGTLNQGSSTTTPLISTSGATTNATEAVLAAFAANATVTWSNVGPGTLISPASTSIATMFFVSSTASTQSWNPTTSAGVTGDGVINTFFAQPSNQPQAIYTRRYVQFYN